MSFPYKKVLVIGATSGIGKAISERLVKNGVSILITGRRKENLDEFVAAHGSDKVQAKVFDVLKLDDVCPSIPNPRQTGKTAADNRGYRSPNSPRMFSPQTPTSTASSSTPVSNARSISPTPPPSTSTLSTQSSSPTTPRQSV